MLDFSNISAYRENNRIEAKKAVGGLPQSIWETVSAFANTMGGIILLGVIENKDLSLDAVELPDPEALVREFNAGVNDPARVSVNVLSAHDVFVQETDGRRIVVINVPRADRAYKPVYLDGDVTLAYKRDGEGDYRCTIGEIEAMRRDASAFSPDMRPLTGLSPDVLCPQTLADYRARMRAVRPGHVWNALDDGDFLLKLGATAVGADGKRCPTAAGLLMFGTADAIAREFPGYSLTYTARYAPGARRADCLQSGDGSWSGNVCDFRFRVCGRLHRSVKLPRRRGDPASVRDALREALVNCLVNADYAAGEALTVARTPETIVFSNPGAFRIEPDTARSGGVSDPRNAAMKRMFDLIDVGPRGGSGIPNIFRVWREAGWADPYFREAVRPARITLTLPLTKEPPADAPAVSRPPSTALVRESVVAYLTDRAQGRSAEIAEALGVPADRVRKILAALRAEGVVVSEDAGRTKMYKLRR